MRRTLVSLALLSACYSPDYTTKPCVDNSGCPSGYFCSTAKVCAVDGSNAGADMAPDPRPKRVEVEVRPSGSFYMGTSATDGINDKPPYLRNFNTPYFLDEREVTVAEYRTCVMAQVCTAPVTGAYGNETPKWNCTYGVNGQDQHPVTCVTKDQADQFCKWMDRRLPTEVEWEYAALGLNGSTGQRMVFPDPLGGNACWNMNGSCPVAGFVKTYLGQIVNKDSPGFYDLLGNAWEKTSSSFCIYPAESCSPETKLSVRGGSGWDSDLKFSKATSRLGNTASEFYPNQGFRCARDSKP